MLERAENGLQRIVSSKGFGKVKPKQCYFIMLLQDTTGSAFSAAAPTKHLGKRGTLLKM